jgi:hypothetical protein
VLGEPASEESGEVRASMISRVSTTGAPGVTDKEGDGGVQQSSRRGVDGGFISTEDKTRRIESPKGNTKRGDPWSACPREHTLGSVREETCDGKDAESADC